MKWEPIDKLMFEFPVKSWFNIYYIFVEFFGNDNGL